MTKQRFNTFKSYGVDSKWELKLRDGVFQGVEYHPQKINYIKPETKHTYSPDWKLDTKYGTIFVEAKGRFRDRQEYTKYLHVREALLPTQTLVFLFMNPATAMPGAKRRKNGTIRSHAEWADGEGFAWYDERTIVKLMEETR